MISEIALAPASPGKSGSEGQTQNPTCQTIECTPLLKVPLGTLNKIDWHDETLPSSSPQGLTSQGQTIDNLFDDFYRAQYHGSLDNFSTFFL